MISKRDLQLGKIALRQGMITKDQLTRALALQKKLVKTKGKKVALGALLIKKEYLTAAQLEEIVKLHNERAGTASEATEGSEVGSTSDAPTASGDASEEAPAKPPEKKRPKGERSARAARASADDASSAGEAPTATATREASRRQRRDEGEGDEAARKKDKRASKADLPASGKNGAEAGPSRRSRRAEDEAEAPPKKAPPRRPSASDSDVDPAVFQSAPEDAVDEDDRRLIACPECGKKYRVRQAQVGKRFGCRRCKNKVKVPKDLFTRPIASGAPGGAAGVEVEEFTLGSDDATGSGSGEAEPPKTSVRTAAARAAVAIERVQAQPSIAELAKAAQVAQKKGLPPRTKFGPAQAATLVVCLAALGGMVGGVVVLKQRAADVEAAAHQERLDREFGGWREGLDKVLARVEGAVEKGSPIDISTLLTELGNASKAKATLIQGDNRARADGYEEQQGLPAKVRALRLARAQALERQGGVNGAREALEEYRHLAAAAPGDDELALLYARRLVRARRVAEAAALLEPRAAGSPAALALRGYAFERGDAGTKAVRAYGQLKEPLAPVLAARAHVVDRSVESALDALGKASGLEGQAAAAAKVVEAMALELKGDAPGAERALREAAALGGDTPFPRVALGELLLRRGRADEALKELQAANLVSGTARGFLATGDALATRMEIDRARTFYRDAAGQPLLPSGALLVAGEVDPFEAPFAPDPRAAARCRLAALELAAGNAVQARAQLGEAQGLDPFSAEAEAGLARVDLLEGNLTLCEARLATAMALLKRLDGAESEVVRSPVAGRVLVVRGAFLIEHGRHQEAGEVLGVAASIDPGLGPQVATLRGRMFDATSQHTRAYEAYTDAARAEVQEQLPGGGEFAAALRRFQEGADPAALAGVLDGITATLAANPYHARAHLLRAQALIRLEKHREALADLERAVVLNQYLRDAYVARGLLYVRDLPEREQTRETAGLALADFQTALKIEQRQGAERPETHTGLALVFLRQNDLLQAQRAADRAVELDAEHAEAYRVRALVRARQGNAQGAKADEQKHQQLMKQPAR
ncbi:MAG: tetratricopeptide repeat protein [Planctomycetes bacterium]|nr:tetratricopeptide repeat protein [Planctomycetota bacterium]